MRVRFELAKFRGEPCVKIFLRDELGCMVGFVARDDIVVASKHKVGTVTAVNFQDEDEDIRAQSYMQNGSIAIELA